MTILAARPGTPSQRRHTAVCPRCGRERQVHAATDVGRLCGDCRLVARDLAEQEVWA